MTLSELIMCYRKENGLSQRKFAELTGLSNGYISMLENGKNPKTNLPIIPTLVQLKKLAQGMKITLSELFIKADDIDVSLEIENTKTDTTENGNIIIFTPDTNPTTQKLLVFNKNGIPDSHEIELPSDDVLNEINKLVKALRPYPAEQIHTLLEIVENGGNLRLDIDLPPEHRELLSVISNLSKENIKTLIQVAKSMK